MTILIDNFSMGLDTYTALSGLEYFAVDVVDHDNSISTSGTYFLLDGEVVPTNLSGISDGYRVYYYVDSPSLSGTVVLTIWAENDILETVTNSYTFLLGYRLEFNDYIDWGPRNTVITTVRASNTAFCPNLVGASTYFETVDYESRDLGAYISGTASVNLGAQIYPQNTFFFYGRTYTITVVGVKDFSGNIMDPITFSFTIENPND